MNIVLIDPSLRDNNGKSSINLGDIIIYESVEKVLAELFPNEELDRISSHTYLEKGASRRIRKSDFCFIGGTNILSSDVRKYNQWKYSPKDNYFVFPSASNVILLGVGWWQYQTDPAFWTKHFYRMVLSRATTHSLRDGYSLNQFKKIGKLQGMNTGCPTTWTLDGQETNRKNRKNKHCLLSVTDYKPNILLDEMLINSVLSTYSEKIIFFPQGSRDLEYFTNLDIYKANKKKFELLPHEINELKSILTTKSIDHVGTRLHLGIKCMQYGIQSLIVGVDNRALEMRNDIFLPVVNRDDKETMKKWLSGETQWPAIKLAKENIASWKRQFQA